MDRFCGGYDLVLNKDEVISVSFEYAEFECVDSDEVHRSIRVTELLYNGKKVYEEDLSDEHEAVVKDSLHTHLILSTDGRVH